MGNPSTALDTEGDQSPLFSFLNDMVAQFEEASGEEDADARAAIERLRLVSSGVTSASTASPLSAADVAARLEDMEHRLASLEALVSDTVDEDPIALSILQGTAAMWLPLLSSTTLGGAENSDIAEEVRHVEKPVGDGMLPLPPAAAAADPASGSSREGLTDGHEEANRVT
eukprot:TRINITY_DN1060_c0_g1_i3.p1 TRINITY_DN1060_c0_g1~~TRINITY_DN1060_c0_g1_i3.p1  ORF type:complete len:171 (-),score=62.64 TRINITY_DN1060_c0_g1_i3:183-695(-)